MTDAQKIKSFEKSVRRLKWTHKKMAKSLKRIKEEREEVVSILSYHYKGNLLKDLDRVVSQLGEYRLRDSSLYPNDV